MKKIILPTLIALLSISVGFSQVNTFAEAPLNNASTTGFRAPNGTAAYAFMRACALVLPSELTNIPLGTTISSFGFTLSTGATIPVAGNFTVYLQNTSDLTYLKGTNFPTAIAGMTVAYASVMTIPQAAGTASILLTLSTPIVYTGAGLYVAYDWDCAGPYSSANAVYLAENGTFLNPGCASAGAAVGPAPTALGTSGFRPSFLFGFANPNSNDVQVVGLEAPGIIPLLFNSPHNIVGVIKNASNIAKTNITVSLTVAGVNPVSTTQIIPSLAAGAYTTVTFGPYNPQLPGANSISVTVAPDQNNSNNVFTYSQNITCNSYAQNPATGNFTGNNIGLGVGAGLVVAKLVNPVSSTLTSINMAISTDVPSVGNAISGVLLNAAGAIIATTNTITLTSLQLGTVLNFSFALPQQLTANTTYYYGFAQPANVNQYYPAGAVVSSYFIGNNYFTTPIGGGALSPVVVNSGYPYLEAILSPPFSVSVTPPITCAGASVSISANGPTSYTWSQGGTPIGSTQSITVFPLVSTAYSFVGTNTLGCNYSGTYMVLVNPLPNIAINSSTNEICIGSSVTFTASGGFNYFLNNAPSSATVTQSPTITTSYVISGNGVNGCINTATLNVTVNSLTLSVTSNTAICLGKSVVLSASSTGNYSYNWNLGSVNVPFGVTSPISPTQTATYSVTAIDNNNGCSNTNTVLVTVNANPTVMIASSSPTVCKGVGVTLTASGASTYSWNTNATGATLLIAPATTTNYIATGTNTDGCTSSASFQQMVFICTSLNDIDKANSVFQIFPNPNNGQFTVHTDQISDLKTVEIYNMLGALIQTVEINSTTTNVDFSQQPNGLYLVKVLENNKLTQVNRIIKQ